MLDISERQLVPGHCKHLISERVFPPIHQDSVATPGLSQLIQRVTRQSGLIDVCRDML